MKKKYWILISFIWLIFIGVLAVCHAWPNIRRQEFTYENKSCTAGTVSFVTETIKDRGYLYRLEENGKAGAIASADAVEKNAVYDAVLYEKGETSEEGSVYALLKSSRVIEENRVSVYRILLYNKDLSLLGQSEAFLIEEAGLLSGFSADETAFYLTSVSETGEKAYAYMLDRTSFEPKTSTLEEAVSGEEAEKEKKETIHSISCSLLKESETGRYISQAEYQDGILYAALDNGENVEKFHVSDTDRERYENRKLSLYQMLLLSKDVLIWCVILLIAGYIILFLTGFLLRNRNRVVYMMFALEALLLVLIAAGCLCVFKGRKNTEKEIRDDFCFHYLESIADREGGLNGLGASEEGWYDSEEYRKLQQSIADCMRSGDVGSFFEDICVVRASDGVIVASGSGKNLVPVGSLYTKKAKETVNTLAQGTQKIRGSIRLSHVSHQIYGVSGKKSVSPSYVLVGIGSADMSVSYLDIVFGGILFFLIGSVMCTLFMIWQLNDLRKLESAMEDMVKGEAAPRHTQVYGNDMHHMWGSLLETDKTIKNISYSRYRIFEAYCRFAPKNIEKVLQKDYITEVSPGDSREISGSMAVICLADEKWSGREAMERLSRQIALIEECRKKQNGILVAMDSSLSMIQILFMENTGNPYEFSVDLLHALDADGSRASILLYRSVFLYGVAGTEEQCFSFIYSKEKEQIEQCLAWLGKMGLGLIITEDIPERGRSMETRCLGHVMLNGRREPVKLYEVLDTCPDEERRGKLKYLEAFDQALQLFYQRDFYLARSMFTEILRAMPEDGIVRWYIFTCEKYLNKTDGESVSFSLN